MKTLIHACIGAGAISDKKHLAQYGKLPGIRMAAICDINRPAAERMAEKYAIERGYTDYRAMLSEVKPDIVSICTARNASGKQLMVGLNNRFSPESAYVMQCVENGFFGEI